MWRSSAALACLGVATAALGWTATARAQGASSIDGRYVAQLGLTGGRGCSGSGVRPYEGDARTATISDGATRLALGDVVYSIHYDGSRVSGSATLPDRASEVVLRQSDAGTFGGRAEVRVAGRTCAAMWSVVLRRAASPDEHRRAAALRARERCDQSGLDCRVAAEAAIADGERGRADAERFARRACEAREPDAAACELLASLSSALDPSARARACALGALGACSRDVPVALESGAAVLAWLRRSGALALPERSYVVDDDTVGEREASDSGSSVLLAMHEIRSRGRLLVVRGRRGEAARAWSGALRGLTRALGPPDRECAGDGCSFGRRAVWLFRGAVLDLIGGGSEFQLHFHAARRFDEVPAREVPSLDPGTAAGSSSVHTSWHCYCADDEEEFITVCASTSRACAAASGDDECMAVGSSAHPAAVLGPAERDWFRDDDGALVHEGGCLLIGLDECRDGMCPGD